MSQIEPPIVPLSPREKRIAYITVAAVVLSVAAGWIVSAMQGSAAYFWAAVAVAVTIHTAFAAWIARAHRLPFWRTLLMRLDRRA